MLADVRDAAAAAEAAAVAATPPCRIVVAELMVVQRFANIDGNYGSPPTALNMTHVPTLPCETFQCGSGLPAASLSSGLGRPPILGLDLRRAGASGARSLHSSRMLAAFGMPGLLDSAAMEMMVRSTASIRTTSSCRSRQ